MLTNEETKIMNEAQHISAAAAQALVQIQDSKCGATPLTNLRRRKVSPATRLLIGELGVRYQPLTTANIDSHKARLELLARDLDRLPPWLLGAAIEEWAQTKPFLPKACELIELARQIAYVPETPAQRARRLNAALEARNNQYLRWIVRGDGIEPVDYGDVRRGLIQA